MDKKKVIEFLKFLESNDCLHSEWNWYECNDEGNITDLTEDSEWVVDKINEFINQ